MSTTDLLILGNVNLDLIVGPLDHWPARGTEALVEHQNWRVGGNAGNAIVAAQALGTRFRAVSTLGGDLAGHWLREQLASAPVDWQTVSCPTSVTVAFTHSDGERTFVTQLGHLAELTWEDLRPRSTAGRSQLTLLAGGFLTPRLRQQYPEVLSQLRETGTRVALDMGWPDGGFTPAVRQEVESWLPQVDYLLINELEAQELAGSSGQGGPQHLAQDLQALLAPSGTVAVKCGAQGVVVAAQDGCYEAAAPQVTVLDSVGAGDTWNVAFLHALLQQRSVAEAAHFAVEVASRAISTSPRQFIGL